MANHKAVMDLGTNTFHILVAKVEGNSFQPVENQKIGVKIGEGLKDGLITPAAAKRGLKAIGQLLDVSIKYGIASNEVKIVGTSALRSARNSKDFIEQVYKTYGAEIEVIGGETEAALIFKGVNLTLPNHVSAEPFITMDIGGGSVEFILGKSSKILWKQSFEIGGQRLMDSFLDADPISEKGIEGLRKFAIQTLRPVFKACLEHNPKVFAGSAGTFETLWEIYRLEKNLPDSLASEAWASIPTEDCRKLSKHLIALNRDERIQVPGMIPLRVDMIVVALLLLGVVLDGLNLQEIGISAYALKEGVLASQLDTEQ